MLNYELLFIDNFDMNVEPLYTEEGMAAKPSAASAFFRKLITVLWWLSWAFFLLFAVSLIVALLGWAGVEPLKSQLFVDTDPVSAFIMLLSMLVHISVFLIILKQLQNVCKTLAAGDPFVPENARRLRVIWIAVACGELLRQAGTFLFSHLSSKGIIAYSPSGSSADGYDVTIELRVYVWFLVLALIIFAEVFREGARLRQEQKYTV
ncbi:MAG: DUF2975 domain-containing protein [Acidimicrobiales bacterium]|nr:DUF2975 domain-containing protein [Hyphomonadaceae bacterium]RZV42195.1 MAG: DUF2975 domain-containing protein [Acidimicrobiales bacterium]